MRVLPVLSGTTTGTQETKSGITTIAKLAAESWLKHLILKTKYSKASALYGRTGLVRPLVSIRLLWGPSAAA